MLVSGDPVPRSHEASSRLTGSPVRRARQEAEPEKSICRDPCARVFPVLWCSHVLEHTLGNSEFK